MRRSASAWSCSPRTCGTPGVAPMPRPRRPPGAARSWPRPGRRWTGWPATRSAGPATSPRCSRRRRSAWASPRTWTAVRSCPIGRWPRCWACRPAETSRSRRTPPIASRCASPAPMAPRCPPRSCRCSGRRGPGCRCAAWTWTSTAPTARASRCSSTRRRCSTTTAGRAAPSARSSTSAAGGATPRNSAFSPTPPGCSTPRSITRPRSASWCGWRCRRWPTTRCSTSSPRRARWCGPGSPTATRRARPSCARRWC